MAIDAMGRVYVSTAAGIQVIDPSGRHLGIIRLRADRVGLPMHLLRQEAEPLADRLLRRGVERLAEQLDVRAQAHDLFADVPALGQEGDLAREPQRIVILALARARQADVGALDAKLDHQVQQAEFVLNRRIVYGGRLQAIA